MYNPKRNEITVNYTHHKLKEKWFMMRFSYILFRLAIIAKNILDWEEKKKN